MTRSFYLPKFQQFALCPPEICCASGLKDKHFSTDLWQRLSNKHLFKPNEVEIQESRAGVDGLMEENKCESEFEYEEDTSIEDRKERIKSDALSQKSKDSCITENR